jgi:hypothetical protein
MSFKCIWLADVLKAAGLKVVEQPGWKTRGHGDMKGIKGVLCHHTATKSGNMPSLKILVSGRPDLEGPLSQLGLARDGTYYVIGAGKCFHAGKGAWKPMGLVDNGNSYLIGIEAENDGVGEKWPEAQMIAYAKGCAAMIDHLNLTEKEVIGHKEYAPKRKIDPTFDMDDFREKVKGYMK